MRINMQDKVKAILDKKAITRDNDFYLMYCTWQDEFNNLKDEKMHHQDSFDLLIYYGTNCHFLPFFNNISSLGIGKIPPI